MIKLDKESWNKGRADGMRGVPWKCPKGLDGLSYSSGYIEDEAQRAKRPLRTSIKSRLVPSVLTADAASLCPD